VIRCEMGDGPITVKDPTSIEKSSPLLQADLDSFCKAREAFIVFLAKQRIPAHCCSSLGIF